MSPTRGHIDFFLTNHQRSLFRNGNFTFPQGSLKLFKNGKEWAAVLLGELHPLPGDVKTALFDRRAKLEILSSNR